MRSSVQHRSGMIKKKNLALVLAILVNPEMLIFALKTLV